MGVILTSYGDAAYAHEGYAGQVLEDGSVTGTYSAQTEPRMIGAVVAACDCGWRGNTRYPWVERWDEAAEDAALAEWEHAHARPVLEAAHQRTWQRLHGLLGEQAAALATRAATPAGRLAQLDRAAAALHTAAELLRQLRQPLVGSSGGAR